MLSSLLLQLIRHDLPLFVTSGGPQDIFAMLTNTSLVASAAGLDSVLPFQALEDPRFIRADALF